ncbi:LacI family DNA-binding transcriptional regulator [Vallitalea pronyensis]|uniref:LacI family DNA-binding transcriptional regulator n=1 Tax=Vallitalea pronyensis TaxID=1348613 RepID=A0A8J8SFP0_9FIRM|nr:LacI family DNA-binding transcriptional regulator [Vallitalea pronyensis]QUI21524.1 LacI family DNA-binding transcriptional regulator [Vallitalea pronyensis]
MPTIQEVAKMAGVSVATVSRVLNHSEAVSSATRDKVQAVINQLNYQPNLLGRNLRRSETRMILVLLQNIANSFYSKVVKGMEDVAHDHDYHVLICNTNTDVLLENVYLDFLKNKLVDGVIFTSPAMDKDAFNQLAKRYPVVLCNEYKPGIEAPVITIDNEAAGYEAANHLIRLGHKKIGMISVNAVGSSNARIQGYKCALTEAGLEVNEAYIVNQTFSYKGGMRGIKCLFDLQEPPTAVFCISDIIAVGAIKELKRKGLSVPQDVAVIGFDNNSIAPMYEPSITTIAQPRYDIGRKAMEVMLQRIQGVGDQHAITTMEHELIIRHSTLPSR